MWEKKNWERIECLTYGRNGVATYGEKGCWSDSKRRLGPSEERHEGALLSEASASGLGARDVAEEAHEEEVDSTHRVPERQPHAAHVPAARKEAHREEERPDEEREAHAAAAAADA